MWSSWTWVVLLLLYSYVASVLPVWSLLQPRDYINALQLISILGLLVIGLLGVATHLVDFVAAGWGTSRVGATPRAAIGAGLGTLAGLFFGLPGIIIGPFVGAVLGELTVHRDYARAGKVGVAAWIGFIAGTVVKVGLAFTMIAIFAASMFLF